MLGFCNHLATAVMLVLDRNRYLPFYLWNDSLDLFSGFLDYAEGDDSRQPVVLVDGVTTLARLSKEHRERLSNLKAKMAVFDNFNTLKSLGDKLKVVDVEEDKEGVWRGVELSPAHINNLISSKHAAYDDTVVNIARIVAGGRSITRTTPEEAIYIRPAGTATEKVSSIARLVSGEDGVPEDSLYKLLLSVCSTEEEFEVAMGYALFQVSRAELAKILGKKKARRVVKSLPTERRRRLLRAGLLFRRIGRPGFIEKQYGVPRCDLRLISHYLSEVKS